MKKVSELNGNQLNLFVAMCEGIKMVDHFTVGLPFLERNGELFTISDLNYSKKWSLGGPIIERESMTIWFWGFDEFDNALAIWCAAPYGNGITVNGFGPLEAAMRCYVVSKLGTEVEIPDVLIPPKSV